MPANAAKSTTKPQIAAMPAEASRVASTKAAEKGCVTVFNSLSESSSILPPKIRSAIPESTTASTCAHSKIKPISSLPYSALPTKLIRNAGPEPTQNRAARSACLRLT